MFLVSFYSDRERYAFANLSLSLYEVSLEIERTNEKKGKKMWWFCLFKWLLSFKKIEIREKREKLTKEETLKSD